MVSPTQLNTIEYFELDNCRYDSTDSILGLATRLWSVAPALTSVVTSRYAQPFYSDIIMGAMASQLTSLAIVYSTVYSGADQRKHQSSASLAFVRGIHRWPVNSPHKGPVTRKMFPFDDVIMNNRNQIKQHWVNGMDKWLHKHKTMGHNYPPVSWFQRLSEPPVKLWAWVSNYIAQKILDVIIS